MLPQWKKSWEPRRRTWLTWSVGSQQLAKPPPQDRYLSSGPMYWRYCSLTAALSLKFCSANSQTVFFVMRGEIIKRRISKKGQTWTFWWLAEIMSRNSEIASEPLVCNLHWTASSAMRGKRRTKTFTFSMSARSSPLDGNRKDILEDETKLCYSKSWWKESWITS